MFKRILYIILINTNLTMADEKKYDTSHLNATQKYVTLHNGTESPFENKYWDHKEEGIYVDVINGEALFSSTNKFDSKTGWPSFTKAINSNFVALKEDNTMAITRTEVRSSLSDAHLGHVFNDGPKESGGSRYCINSASLEFIPKNQLKEKGYGKYLFLFEEESDIRMDRAILAGGCFWGMEGLFSNLDGVIDVINGYSGGEALNPDYKLVSSGLTNYAETIEVTFDANIISYEKILKFFFKIHDPTTLNQQGNDIGRQYRSSIFYIDEDQETIAKNVISKINEAKILQKPVATTLEEYHHFYIAEDYHQDYLEKNPDGYTCHYIRDDWDF
jgi:peptide methionine sulfoxide reductase msrA/msrB